MMFKRIRAMDVKENLLRFFVCPCYFFFPVRKLCREAGKEELRLQLIAIQFYFNHLMERLTEIKEVSYAHICTSQCHLHLPWISMNKNTIDQTKSSSLGTLASGLGPQENESCHSLKLLIISLLNASYCVQSPVC